jgi:hypothetical protein
MFAYVFKDNMEIIYTHLPVSPCLVRSEFGSPYRQWIELYMASQTYIGSTTATLSGTGYKCTNSQSRSSQTIEGVCVAE